MIEGKVDGNVGCHMTVEGDLKQIANDVCNIVLVIYGDLRREDPEAADLFRKMVSCVLAEESLFWTKADRLFATSSEGGSNDS